MRAVLSTPIPRMHMRLWHCPHVAIHDMPVKPTRACTQAPRADAGVARPWDMPATLSSSVAAKLRVLDLSGCVDLRSIDIVRCCAQLRCLWMPGCLSVSDLLSLGVCSETLEELWMAGDDQVRSLDPLKACPRLRKLDLRGCLPALKAQVQDLQLSCPHLLAAPPSVEIEGLVHDLQPSIPPDMQEGAASAVAPYDDERRGTSRPSGCHCERWCHSGSRAAAGSGLAGRRAPADVRAAAQRVLRMLGVDDV
jgi:hypothetical protein